MMVEVRPRLGDHASPVAEGSGRTRRLLAALAAATLWASLGLPALVAGAPAWAAPVAASLTLSAAPSSLVAGEPIVLSGSLSTEAVCLAGRTVTLERRLADGSGWEVAGQVLTADDGGFAATLTPAFSARYRAVVQATDRDGTACDGAVSAAAAVAVAARVEAVPSRITVASGGCVRVRTTVSPAKPGQTVRVERWRGDGWVAVATAVLDGASEAAPRLCFAWPDLGAVSLRVVWPVQDALNAAGESATLALEVVRAPWMERIDQLVAGLRVSVSVAEAGVFRYRRADSVERIPASNEKLFLSMALLDELGPGFRVRTRAAAGEVEGGVVGGDLWILGRGDPWVGRSSLRALARRIAASGVTRVRGSVMGSTGYFARDWWAPGWRDDAHLYVALPTALTFEGNRRRGRNLTDPERRTAAALTRRLEALGVRVRGLPGAGQAPVGLRTLAAVPSRPLGTFLRSMNHDSSNFVAEVLGKLLAARTAGPPGTIAGGAAAIRGWAAARGVQLVAYDGSGLSYGNRVTAADVVRLLEAAEREAWGEVLRESLPGPGEGTLRSRLAGIPVRAKTGTLSGVSALSGWVWLERLGAWGEFSILSRGLSKSEAVRIEDAVVRILNRSAR